MSDVPLGAPLEDDPAHTQTQRTFGVKGGTIGSYRLLEALIVAVAIDCQQ
jgi:hypothetical protein